MNGVKFTRENGGLARSLQGTDPISGLIVYGESTHGKALLLSVEELEVLGITPQNSPVLHYHVSEFFRISEGAKLYLQSVASSDGNFTEIKILQNFAEGNIKQLAICDFKTPISELAIHVAKLNQLAGDLAKNNTPLQVIYSAKITSEDMLSLPNLHTLNAERVSVTIAQDSTGYGGYLSTIMPSIGATGTLLGAIAKAKVHESVAWVEKQNLISTAYPKALTADIQKNAEWDGIGFCDGSQINNYSPQQLQSLQEKGYLFCGKYAGRTGTFFNESFTATILESDFAYIENNRVIDKAQREVARVLLPKISGPAYIDPDTGYIEASTVAGLEALCDASLDEMKRQGEISGYSVAIDPTQRLLTSSKLEVILKIVPVGTMRQIEVKIGLTLKNN